MQTVNRLKLGGQAGTGSIINWMMGNNNTQPEVNKGGTLLSYTDRHAFEVLEVSNDGKRIIIQEYKPERIDKNGMSESQDYKYEKLDGYNQELVYRQGAWRKVIREITFEKWFSDMITENGKVFYDNKGCNNFWDKDTNILKLIPNLTKIKTKYSRVNVIFGVKDEYYDYSF